MVSRPTPEPQHASTVADDHSTTTTPLQQTPTGAHTPAFSHSPSSTNLAGGHTPTAHPPQQTPIGADGTPTLSASASGTGTHDNGDENTTGTHAAPPAGSPAPNDGYRYDSEWDYDAIEPPCSIPNWKPEDKLWEEARCSAWTLPLKSLRIQPITSVLVPVLDIPPTIRKRHVCAVERPEAIVRAAGTVKYKKVLHGKWRFSILRADSDQPDGKPRQLYVLWFEPATFPRSNTCHVPQAHFFRDTISRLHVTDSGKDTVLHLNFRRGGRDRQENISCFGPLNREAWTTGTDKDCLDFLLDPVWPTDMMECVVDLDHPGCTQMIEHFGQDIGKHAIYADTFSKSYDDSTYPSCLATPRANDGMMVLEFPKLSVLKNRAWVQGKWPTSPLLEVPAEEPANVAPAVVDLDEPEPKRKKVVSSSVVGTADISDLEYFQTQRGKLMKELETLTKELDYVNNKLRVLERSEGSEVEGDI